MSISVIILHHNKAEYSRACLESLAQSSYRPLEVINVDNGSTDGTAQLLAEWKPEGIEVKTLSFDTNIGAVRGRNEALAVSTGKRITFLDNDVILGQADWLERLSSALDAHDNCGIVVPKLLFPFAPFNIECMGAAISPQGRIHYLERGNAGDAPYEAREIQGAISASWLMKREVVEKIGVLDEAYSPVQYEDFDFCYRAREAGYTVWTEPSAEVFHFEHTTTAGSGDINFKYVTTKNGILFKKRWQSRFTIENGTTEEASKWQVLEKKGIEEVNWRALLPDAKIS